MERHLPAGEKVRVPSHHGYAKSTAEVGSKTPGSRPTAASSSSPFSLGDDHQCVWGERLFGKAHADEQLPGLRGEGIGSHQTLPLAGVDLHQGRPMVMSTPNAALAILQGSSTGVSNSSRESSSSSTSVLNARCHRARRADGTG